MATRLAKLQEDLLDNISVNSSRKDHVSPSEYSGTLAKVKKQLFRFVVLIGGVPPKDLVGNLREKPLATPSLHIMGTSDPLLNESKTLESLYGPGKGDRKRVITHAEGHKIPSMATNLYPEIESWIASFQ
jgi:predicted esterase